jgi:hypothetical protein
MVFFFIRNIINMIPGAYLLVYIIITICTLKLTFYLFKDLFAVVAGIVIGYWLYCRKEQIDFDYRNLGHQAMGKLNGIYRSFMSTDKC